MVYYNEFDANKVAWLRELIKAGAIADGHVDSRSIAEVTNGDLNGFRQWHFLPELEFGPTLFDLRDFQTTENVSLPVARVSRSHKRGNRKALRIDDTFGQSVFGSSGSEDLSWSLANRFRVRTASLGSTLFQLTWKVSRTPQGRRVYVGRASVRPMQETDCTLSGWQTPKLPSGGGQESRQSKGGGLRKLEDQALFASWATPTKRDGKDGTSVGTAPTNALLGRQVWLAAWGTPQKHDACGTKTEDAALKMKELGHGVVNMNEQVRLAGWATPAKNEFEQRDTEALMRRREVCAESTGNGNGFGLTLGNQVQLMDSGEMPTGSTADLKDLEKPESIGQLNPSLPRWMMGLPVEWDLAAIRASEAMKEAKKAKKKS